MTLSIMDYEFPSYCFMNIVKNIFKYVTVTDTPAYYGTELFVVL